MGIRDIMGRIRSALIGRDLRRAFDRNSRAAAGLDAAVKEVLRR